MFTTERTACDRLTKVAQDGASRSVNKGKKYQVHHALLKKFSQQGNIAGETGS
jgi:hypothetical protein